MLQERTTKKIVITVISNGFERKFRKRILLLLFHMVLKMKKIIVISVISHDFQLKTKEKAVITFISNGFEPENL